MEEVPRRDALRLAVGCGLVALDAQGCSAGRVVVGRQDRRSGHPSSGAVHSQTTRVIAEVSAIVAGAPLNVSAAAGRRRT